MSRSYRKNPIVKVQDKVQKKLANHKVRGAKDIPNGRGYRKVHERWLVCDQRSYWTLEECIDRWHNWESRRNWRYNNTIEEEIEWWYKTFYWK